MTRRQEDLYKTVHRFFISASPDDSSLPPLIDVHTSISIDPFLLTTPHPPQILRLYLHSCLLLLKPMNTLLSFYRNVALLSPNAKKINKVEVFQRMCHCDFEIIFFFHVTLWNGDDRYMRFAYLLGLGRIEKNNKLLLKQQLLTSVLPFFTPFISIMCASSHASIHRTKTILRPY